MCKKGYHFTEEHKQKIRDSNLAHPERHLQWTGRHHTSETKKRISIANSISHKGKKRPYQSGNNHWRWQGGYDKKLERIKSKNIIKLEKLAGRLKPKNCEICGRDGKICFDHDHKTGKFRGWVCNRCNVIMVISNDDIMQLKKIIIYLTKNYYGRG